MVEATTIVKEALDSKALATHPTHFFPPQHRPDEFMVAANFYPRGYQVSLCPFYSQFLPRTSFPDGLILIYSDDACSRCGRMGLCAPFPVHPQIQADLPVTQVRLPTNLFTLTQLAIGQ